MKGIICYYSGSGNTKLASQYIINNISHADFELYDIVKNDIPDFSEYDIIGFAAFTDFGGVSQYYYDFFEEMESQPGKFAFVFNTYGFLSGKTQKKLASLAQAKGFTVIAGHSLHTPENYPPMRSKNMASDYSPNEKELYRFNNFISRLDNLIEKIQSQNTIKSEKISIGLINSLFPNFSREKAKKDFGIQVANADLCNGCGTCQSVCPYNAVELNPRPEFDHDRCKGCWRCYNHCPQKAIHTKKFTGQEQYAKPNTELYLKLK